MYFSLLNLLNLFNLAQFITNKNFKFNNHYLFDKISIFQLKILNETKSEELPVKIEFQNKISKIKNGIIQNYYFKNNYFRKIRLTYFKSDDKEMLSCVWYPSYDYDCPILTIDLFNYDDKKTFFFLNLIEIYKSNIYEKKYIEPLFEIKKNYKKLHDDIDFSDKYISKSSLCGKLNNMEIRSFLPRVLEKYFKKYLTYFIKKPVDRYYIENKHREYNNFRENIDSYFLTKEYFDKDWYNRLIMEHYRT
jgi:hypothetical protein